jgi:hypothetical protein
MVVEIRDPPKPSSTFWRGRSLGHAGPDVALGHWAHGEPAPARRAELLIDCEEDRTLRAVLVGKLREADP